MNLALGLLDLTFLIWLFIWTNPRVSFSVGLLNCQDSIDFDVLVIEISRVQLDYRSRACCLSASRNCQYPFTVPLISQLSSHSYFNRSHSSDDSEFLTFIALPCGLGRTMPDFKTRFLHQNSFPIQRPR